MALEFSGHESRRRPVTDPAMNVTFLAKRSKCRAHLPSYVQVETRPEARLLPPLAVSTETAGGVS
jgi:hypothetical protein